MKNSSDTIGNRTRNLPACSAVPQTTAPPRTHFLNYSKTYKIAFEIKSRGPLFETLSRETYPKTGLIITFKEQ